MKYEDAGVNIQKADQAMARISSIVKSTYNSQVEADFGSFGGIFSLKELQKMSDPKLVSSIDGVGTKLKLSIEWGKPEYAGQDIVNHCVGDILVQGAKPLFFLDYFATGELQENVLMSVIEGIAKSCKQNNCVLLGGETAEMPKMYQKGDFDLAGTIVGVADAPHIITGKSIQAGDVLLGLPSSGLHTNGYSLVQKILQQYPTELLLSHTPQDFDQPLGEVLTKPHRSYLKSLYPLVLQNKIKGMVHITGGGFIGNIPRVLPKGLCATVQSSAWQVPPIFKLLQKYGSVEKDEMYRVFNMGIGMVLVVSPQEVDFITRSLPEVALMGEIIRDNNSATIVV